MSKMTLEQVRDAVRDAPYTPPHTHTYALWADAIDAELKARGEPVAIVGPDDVIWLKPEACEVDVLLYTASPTPKITNEALVKLARRCLWLAYVWNDHNFDAAHVCARKTAEDVGIESFEGANTWLQALKETP